MVYCCMVELNISQFFLSSAALGLSKGNYTWELQLYLAPAFWPCSSKALKHVLQNSRLSMYLTVLLDQSHGERGGKLLLSYFDCD